MSTATSGVGPEQAPSETRPETPVVVRYLIGFGGLFFTTLGVASVVAAQYDRGPLGSDWGGLLAALGLAMLVFHALRDGDLEVRRAYGVLGLVVLLIAVGVGVFPAKPDGSDAAVAGHLLLPWGVLLGLAALPFLVAFARHETADPYLTWGRVALLGTGGLAAVGCVGLGVFAPSLMAGPGIALGVLGLAYLCGYFSVADAAEELPYWAGVGVGAVGGLAVAYALFRSIAPEVLHAGPAALRDPNQSVNKWSVFGRVLLVLLGLSGLFALWAKRWPLLVRGGVAAVGVGFATVFVVGSFAAPWSDPPDPYLVPGGLLLGGLGAAFLAVAVAVTVDAPVVVLLRRELAAIFYSPVAYVVLFGNALIAGLAYLFFIGLLFGGGAGFQRPTVPEPIVAYYPALTLAAFIVPVLVAVITMRTFAEEKRSGTLEVLLTAPVNDWAVVLSKFAAALTFFMLCWLPAVGFLVVLRYAGGTPFDYRPLLSYFLALFACGVSFVGLGVFVSSLTRNQIAAAMITFAALFGMLLTRVRERMGMDLPAGVRGVLGKLDYMSLWEQALGGQLPIPEVCVQVSLGVFWLFLTIKVLEARRWG